MANQLVSTYRKNAKIRSNRNVANPAVSPTTIDNKIINCLSERRLVAMIRYLYKMAVFDPDLDMLRGENWITMYRRRENLTFRRV